jgi:RNA polymerase sigma-70 factor (ECF subfamily)
MPPWRQWYAGREAIAAFFTWATTSVGQGPLPFRLVPAAANRQPAAGVYVRNGAGRYEAHALHVLTLRGDVISGVTSFRDTRLFDAFGMPRVL